MIARGSLAVPPAHRNVIDRIALEAAALAAFPGRVVECLGRFHRESRRTLIDLPERRLREIEVASFE